MIIIASFSDNGNTDKEIYSVDIFRITQKIKDESFNFTSILWIFTSIEDSHSKENNCKKHEK